MNNYSSMCCNILYSVLNVVSRYRFNEKIRRIRSITLEVRRYCTCCYGSTLSSGFSSIQHHSFIRPSHYYNLIQQNLPPLSRFGFLVLWEEQPLLTAVPRLRRPPGCATHLPAIGSSAQS